MCFDNFNPHISISMLQRTPYTFDELIHPDTFCQNSLLSHQKLASKASYVFDFGLKILDQNKKCECNHYNWPVWKQKCTCNLFITWQLFCNYHQMYLKWQYCISSVPFSNTWPKSWFFNSIFSSQCLGTTISLFCLYPPSSNKVEILNIAN